MRGRRYGAHNVDTMPKDRYMAITISG